MVEVGEEVAAEGEGEGRQPSGEWDEPQCASEQIHGDRGEEEVGDDEPVDGGGGGEEPGDEEGGWVEGSDLALRCYRVAAEDVGRPEREAAGPQRFIEQGLCWFEEVEDVAVEEVAAEEGGAPEEGEMEEYQRRDS